MTADFANKTIVVTGAAGDIAAVVVRKLADRGATVIAADLDERRLAQTVGVVTAAGGDAHAVAVDVTEEGQVASLFERAATRGGGKIDGFFNNAGVVGSVSLLDDTTADEFDRTMRINVRGTFLGMKHALPYLNSGGVIVNTGSTASMRGSPGLSPYVASKHAVLGLTRAAAIEAAPRGIRICAICPGPVAGRLMSEMNAKRRELGFTSGAGAGLADGRYAETAEIANAVLFLLSAEASFVSGTGLVVDGGRLA